MKTMISEIKSRIIKMLKEKEIHYEENCKVWNRPRTNNLDSSTM